MKHRIANTAKLCLSLMCLFFCGLSATSLDGTSNIVYTTVPQVFHNGEFAKGFVALEKGFTVPAMSGARLNLVVPVSYGMDLRTTGSIILENNLQLDSGFTLSSSGTICGNGHSLILNGNLIIPTQSTLKITSSLTIEGNGHTLFLDNFAQILTDTHSTLTLRNLIIQNVINSTGRPPIAANGTDSKIALDNVELKFENDFYFNRGSLFFHNDVLYSGQTSFFYSSQQPSYVAPQSTLCFDNNSTFYYLPSNTNKNLFVMQDESSILNLDNCSFVSSLTGMTLNQGKMLLSNQVSIEGATSIFNPLVPGISKKYGSSINAMDWSPDGNYLAIVGNGAAKGAGGFNNHDELRIYQLNLSQADFLVTVTSMPYGANIQSVNWSPNGNYLAFGGSYSSVIAGGFNNHDDIRVYQFNPAAKTLTAFTSVRYAPGYTNCTINALKWSPDGAYLAIGARKPYITSINNPYKNVRIYYFNQKAQTLSLYASSSFDGQWYDPYTVVNSIDWHITGNYVVAVGLGESNADQFSLFNFNKYAQNFNDRLTFKVGLHNTNNGPDTSVSWSPNGRFIALTRNWRNSGDVTLTIYKFDPVAGLSTLLNPNIESNISTVAAKWDPTGTFLSLGSFLYNLPSTNYLIVGKFEYNAITGIATFNAIQRQQYGASLNSTCWHPTISLVNAGGNGANTFGSNPNTNEYQCYNCLTSAQELVDSKKVAAVGLGDGRGIDSTSISYDGKYCAIGGNRIIYPSTSEIQLFRINNISGQMTLKDLQRYGNSPFPYPDAYATTFNPKNNTLAIGGEQPAPSGGFSNYDQLRLYKIENDLLTPCTSIPVGDVALHARIQALAWHPTGKYLALGCYGAQSGYGGFANTHNVRVYEFDGATLTPITSYDFGQTCYALSWSPDGNYLAAGGYGTDAFVICKFTNYSSLDKIVTKPYGSGNPGVTCIDWNMNNQNLLVIGNGNLIIGKFTGTDVNQITSYAGASPVANWSPDGRFIITFNPNAGNLLKFFSFDGTNIAEVTSKNTALRCKSIAWNRLGNYLVAGGSASYATSGYLPQLLAYKINRIANTLEQRTSMDIGEDFDINVLGGANVQINGIIKYNEG